MDILTLRRFCALEGFPSISSAAQSLFVSQQGLNKAISSLEKEVGLKLIERSPEGIALTEAGRILAEGARAALECYDNALIEASRADLDPAVFETDSSAGLLLITPYAGEAVFGHTEPPVNMIVRELPFVSIIQELKNGQGNGREDASRSLAIVDLFSNGSPEQRLCDLGLRPEIFRFEPLVTTRLGLLVASDSPIAHQDAISIEELAGIPLAIVKDETIDDVLATLNVEDKLNIRLRMRNIPMLLRWVKDGQGAALLDSLSFFLLAKNKHEAEGLSFVTLDTPFIDTVGFLFRKDDCRMLDYRSAIDRLRFLFDEANATYFDDGDTMLSSRRSSSIVSGIKP